MRHLLALVLILTAGTSFAKENLEADRPPPLNCQAGPLSKTYGQTQWLVYACDDKRSVVVASDKGNPALPFYFIIYVKENGDIRLYGEGTGKKSATQPAFDDLQKLSAKDIAALVEQAQASATGGDGG